MTMTNEQILDALAEKSVMDVVELVKMMEEKFGVTAAAPVAVAAAPAAGSGEAEAAEQTEFNVVLTSVGDKKINVIKAIRAITSLPLKEAKDLVEGAPATIKESVDKDEAASIQKQIEEAGGSVELK